MQCLRFTEWGGPLRKADVPVPTPGKAEVLVEVEAAGVGRTVQHVIDGQLKADPSLLPRIPGHEYVGSVASVGAGVTTVAAGDLVTPYFHLACGRCRACLAGRDSRCANHAGWISVDSDGGYAEYALLPERNAMPIPDSIDPIAATTIPDAVATPVHVANSRLDITPGDDIAIIGAGGGVGIHMVQVASYFGAAVTAVDIDDDKLAHCLDVGARTAVNTERDGLQQGLADVEHGFDAVIDFSGDGSVFAVATEFIRPGGTIVTMTADPAAVIEVPTAPLVNKEIGILGSRYCSKYELLLAADLVATNEVTPVVSTTVDIDGVADLLANIVANEVVGRGAMIPG